MTRHDLTTFYAHPPQPLQARYTKSHSVDSTFLKVESCPLVATRYDLIDDILYTPTTTTSRTFYSLTLSTRRFLKSMSCPLVATRLDLTTFYTPPPHPLQTLSTKYHSVDSTFPKIESCPLVATRHDLTTFYTPPTQPLDALLY